MIEFSEHAIARMNRRKVSKVEIIETLGNPDDVLFDIQTGYFIAIRKRNGKWLIVVYVPEDNIKIISAIVTSKF